MKKLALLFLFSLLSATIHAQAKFGYLSYDNTIKSMPGYAGVQGDLDTLKRQYDAETKRAEDEFNQKYESFLDGQKDFAPVILRKRQAELQDLLNRNLAFRKEADRLLKQAEADMLAPLKTRLNEALRQICLERGYEFILNTDNNAVPFINPAYGEDISAAVEDILKK